MEIAINDLSFKGQFESIDEVEKCINAIADISDFTKKINGNAPIRRTRTLGNRLVTHDTTITMFLTGLMSRSGSSDRDLVNKVLVNLVQGPFIRASELNEELKEVKSHCGESIDNTAIHAYISKEDESIHAVISAPKSTYDSYSTLKIGNGSGSSKTILNFRTNNCCQNFFREYSDNEKHELTKDIVVDGKVHTRMDLDDNQARACLSNGIQVLGSIYVYSYVNDKWYQFRSHRPNMYHGFPIGTPTNFSELNHIIKIFGKPPYEKEGYRFCLP